MALSRSVTGRCAPDSLQHPSFYKWAVEDVIHVSYKTSSIDRSGKGLIDNVDPKHIWSPAGGWWSRPKNWASNTAICAVGIVGVTAWVWSISARLETRDRQPTRWIPSMIVCRHDSLVLISTTDPAVE